MAADPLGPPLLWLTPEQGTFAAERLLLVEEADQKGAGKGEYLVALDMVGADRGQLVLLTQGSSCRWTSRTDDRPMDTLVVAISEEPEGDLVEGLKRKPWGGLVINPESYITSQKRVFGGGDVVTGPSTVIEAVAAGKNAAVMIDRHLTGKQLRMVTRVALPTVYVPPELEAEEEFPGGGPLPLRGARPLRSPSLPALRHRIHPTGLGEVSDASH